MVKNDPVKHDYLQSLSPGSLITVQYRSTDEEKLNHGLNSVGIYGLTANGITIITPKEIQQADSSRGNLTNRAGLMLLALGCIASFIRKRKKREG